MLEKRPSTVPSTYADRLQFVCMVIAPLLARHMRMQGLFNLEKWLLLSATGVHGLIGLPLATKEKPVIDPFFDERSHTKLS